MTMRLGGGIGRRTFLKASLAAGIAISVRPLGAAAPVAGFDARMAAADTGWRQSATTAARRIDGPPKVTGAKLYAADFRAADMPGWPRATAHAMLLKTPDATHIFEGIDLAALDRELMPDRVVLAEDLATAGITVPEFYAGDLLCPAGKTPLYLGQPVALLIWNNFAGFALARRTLQLAPACSDRRGNRPARRATYGAARFVRVAGPTRDSEDVYSPMLAGWTFPVLYQKDDRPDWAVPSTTGADASRASYYGDRIRAEISATAPDRFVLDRSFQTQSIDQVFLEPEAGFAWYDGEARKVELVIGVQSPHQAAASVATLMSRNAADKAVGTIVMHCAYVGGAFGGKDHTIYQLYVALAGSVLAGRPVRLANDRFDQFQFGIKRHAVKVRSRMAIYHRVRRITAFVSDQELDGGGLANLSAAVAFVGATASIGMYDVPKVDVYDGGAALACRHRRLDAWLRRLADPDGARGDDRRSGGEPRPGSGSLSQGQPARDRRQDHGRQHRLGRAAER